ncbi:5-deoxy-glucuronate isomerase [Aminobacter sp. MET-1]|jgi:5-deoxy-glucuronate isomerase|uniref:5-deoxy-glucuronate isomerase n=1 Tax=Aminobacter sp. MET-1 TaxID=2951085 RepID=UPI002269A4A5|nr:5-deoxy-glucuronate isomerase [Aminobacter sp. MET-1]MCX8569891.1 5-deoxy-glucuronate isomerase [Aminobacter sp. MET-1]
MSKLLIKPKHGTGRVTHVTPESAGWTYVGFDLHRLEPGDTFGDWSNDRETCLVLVSGKAHVRADDQDLGTLGERTTPFEGKPWSVYMPAGTEWSVRAQTNVELAVCSAPGLGGGHATRVIGPDDVKQEVRGKGTNTRYVTNILPEGEPADSLLVVEVITPGGHTSSYPPHKHDQDNLPAESLLEETYYHRLNPPQGFAFQRVYTEFNDAGHREIDEAMAVEDGDVTLVPKGYHPCAACHGYDLYYLNVMAGPKRTWKFHNAKEHEWLLKA